jgi:hypothetical protein
VFSAFEEQPAQTTNATTNTPNSNRRRKESRTIVELTEEIIMGCRSFLCIFCTPGGGLTINCGEDCPLNDDAKRRMEGCELSELAAAAPGNLCAQARIAYFQLAPDLPAGSQIENGSAFLAA